MLKARFLSDIHLTSLSDQRGQSFLRLVKGWRGAEMSHLFLVGDIFDLWLANQSYFINRYAEALAELRRLKSEGVEIHYFEGNHDLYLKSFWENELGIPVHTGAEIFTLGTQRVLVEHGDEFDPDDTGYLFLRWFLRTPPLRFLAHHLPSALVVALGDRASRASRQYTDQKAATREDKLHKLHRHAEMIRKEREFDLLINGHVHIADDFRWAVNGGSCRAMNLGSWLKEPYGYLELTDSGPQMKYI